MQLHRIQFSLIMKDYQTERFKVSQKDFNKKLIYITCNTASQMKLNG